MVISIVMVQAGEEAEGIVDSVTETAPERPRRVPPWLVELNIAGCTIRRRAVRRRDLLGLPARAV